MGVCPVVSIEEPHIIDMLHTHSCTDTHQYEKLYVCPAYGLLFTSLMDYFICTPAYGLFLCTTDGLDTCFLYRSRNKCIRDSQDHKEGYSRENP